MNKHHRILLLPKGIITSLLSRSIIILPYCTSGDILHIVPAIRIFPNDIDSPGLVIELTWWRCGYVWKTIRYFLTSALINYSALISCPDDHSLPATPCNCPGGLFSPRCWLIFCSPFLYTWWRYRPLSNF